MQEEAINAAKLRCCGLRQHYRNGVRHARGVRTGRDDPKRLPVFRTPYLWLASVHATTLTPLAHAPQVNSNVSTIDLLSHLDGAPFMGSFEVRYGSLGFLADVICSAHVSQNVRRPSLYGVRR